MEGSQLSKELNTVGFISTPFSTVDNKTQQIGFS